jgi:hypothetical protein
MKPDYFYANIAPSFTGRITAGERPKPQRRAVSSISNLRRDFE